MSTKKPKKKLKDRFRASKHILIGNDQANCCFLAFNTDTSTYKRATYLDVQLRGILKAFRQEMWVPISVLRGVETGANR